MMNIPTLLILLLLALAIFMAVRSIKRGKGRCDGNCHNCMKRLAKKR